jgi:hypothetical protein
MPNMVFAVVHAPYEFDIARAGTCLWRVDERHGLVGGMFRTRKAALRFALSEADGNRRCIHFPRTGHSRR